MWREVNRSDHQAPPTATLCCVPVTHPNRARGAWRRLAAGLAAGLVLASGTALGSVPVDGAAWAAPGDGKYEPKTCGTKLPGAMPEGGPWQVERLRMPELHELATGDGVRIAVIDTGVFFGRSAHQSGMDLTWKDFADTDKARDGRVDCDHGTFVTSLIIGQPGTEAGTPATEQFSGIAPGATVIAMRALQESNADPDELESLDPTIDAVQAAIDADVDIISISQQGTDDPRYRAVIKKAVDAGILVVAAAGNYGEAGATYPANYPGVMAVAMTDRSDQPDAASQWGGGMEISVAAPGTAVVGLFPLCSESECPDSGPAAYGSQTGTSFAAPLVAGAAALVMERHPDLTAAQVKLLLEETADPPTADPAIVGHGIINPYQALTGPRPPAVDEDDQQVGKVHIPPVAADTDHLQRNTALAVAGVSLAIVAVSGVVAAALPAGRRRHWKPADKD